MIPEWGSFALMLAFGLSLLQSSLPLVGAWKQREGWMAIAQPIAWTQFLLIGFSALCLSYAFMTNDFSVNYVMEHSSFALPLRYRFAAMWGGHEGSLLLWLLILNSWIVALLVWHHCKTISMRMPLPALARTLGVLGLINAGFLWFLLATSNPFLRNFLSVPLEGSDLNPLLQDPGLIFHPPMLYVGYVGYAMVFALAVAALLSGQFTRQWASWMRPWALLSWLSLTLGIVLGSWWAYRELGWGGFWFWDPVENASLLPWLVGTALLHSLAVSEKRGVLKAWTVLLAIIAFALSLLGTFLVRSGVLVSVHTFANDPERGEFLLAYLFVVVTVSLLLYAWRGDRLRAEQSFEGLSKETCILTNNLLLMVMMLTILIGTLYPLLLDVLGWGKISVGSPYFNSVFLPLAFPLFLLMGVGPLCYWQSHSPRALLKRLWLIFVISVLGGVLLPWMAGQTITLLVVTGITLALWIVLATLLFLARIIHRHGGGWHGLKAITWSQYGMSLAHIGVAITLVGITVVSHYRVERDVRMALQETINVAGYDYTFTQLTETRGPNYQALSAHFTVQQHDHPVTHFIAQKRIYDVSGMPIAEVAIQPGWLRDLYLVLGEQLEDGSWTVRIYYEPFIRWVWLGGFFMVAGGLLSVGDRRRQRKSQERVHV